MAGGGLTLFWQLKAGGAHGSPPTPHSRNELYSTCYNRKKVKLLVQIEKSQNYWYLQVKGKTIGANRKKAKTIGANRKKAKRLVRIRKSQNYWYE